MHSKTTIQEFQLSIKELKKKLVEICNSYRALETCGFIAFDSKAKKYILTVEKNESSDPSNFFMINPARFLFCKERFSLLGVFHSHIVADESPSEFDIKMSEACCIPFLVYSLNTEKISTYEPKNKDYDEGIFLKIKKYLK